MKGEKSEYAWLIETIKKFLLMNKAEVKGILLTEYNQDKVLEQTVYYKCRQTAIDMLRDGNPFVEIKKYSRLYEDMIRNLVQSLGLTV